MSASHAASADHRRDYRSVSDEVRDSLNRVLLIEDDDDRGDQTTIHAYDVSTVEIVESRRNDGRIETETTSNGRPHLIVHTDDPDHIRVVRLDRSRFDG